MMLNILILNFEVFHVVTKRSLLVGYLISHRLCLGAWSDHGERTGGFYACNRYESAKQEGVVSFPVCP